MSQNEEEYHTSIKKLSLTINIYNKFKSRCVLDSRR